MPQEWKDDDEDALIVYTHMGVPAVPTGDERSEGTMRLRADLRGADGPLAAPLGLLQQSASGIFIDHNIVTPMQIEVHIADPARNVEVVRNENVVLRQGGRVVFTEGRFVDHANPDRLIGYGHVLWAVLAKKPPHMPMGDYAGMVYGGAEDPAPGSLPATFDVHQRDDGEYEITESTPRIASRGGLHGGTIAVLVETATTGAAERAAGGPVAIADHGLMCIGAAQVGPYVSRSEVTSVTDEQVVARTEIHDLGAEDRLVAVGQSRFRRLT